MITHQVDSKNRNYVYISQGMQTGYTMAMEAQVLVGYQGRPCHMHTVHPQSAGPIQGCTEQPHQQGSLQAAATSNSTPGQGFFQQPSQSAAPAVPQHQGSLPQQLCHQGMPLQPCQGPAAAAFRPCTAQTCALVPSSVPQQPEDEEVCCAQPALPSAQPQQQLAARGNGTNENSHMQAPTALNSTGPPADRTSSSGQVGDKANQNGHLTNANQPTRHGNMQRAPGAGLPASAAILQPQDAAQGQPRGSHASAPDKENAGTGNRVLCSTCHYQLLFITISICYCLLVRMRSYLGTYRLVSAPARLHRFDLIFLILR